MLCTPTACRPTGQQRVGGLVKRFGRLLTSRSRESTRVKRGEPGAAPECKDGGKWEIPEKTPPTNGLRPARSPHRHQTHDGHITKRQQPSAPLSPERMTGVVWTNRIATSVNIETGSKYIPEVVDIRGWLLACLKCLQMCPDFKVSNHCAAAAPHRTATFGWKTVNSALHWLAAGQYGKTGVVLTNRMTLSDNRDQQNTVSLQRRAHKADSAGPTSCRARLRSDVCARTCVAIPVVIAWRVQKASELGAMGTPCSVGPYCHLTPFYWSKRHLSFRIGRLPTNGRSHYPPTTKAKRVQFPARGQPGFSRVGIVPDDAACRLVLSGYSRFPRPYIPAQLHPRSHFMSYSGMTHKYGSQLEKARHSEGVASAWYKIEVKHIYSDVRHTIGSQFIRPDLDASEPIAESQDNAMRGVGQQPMNTHLRLQSSQWILRRSEAPDGLLVGERQQSSGSRLRIAPLTPTRTETPRYSVTTETLHALRVGAISRDSDSVRLDSTALCSLWSQMFVHWLLAVWHLLLVSLQFCHWLRVVQGVSNELAYEDGENGAALECKGGGKRQIPEKTPRTSGIVRHYSHMRKSGVTRPGIEPGSHWWKASGCVIAEGKEKGVTRRPAPYNFYPGLRPLLTDPDDSSALKPVEESGVGGGGAFNVDGTPEILGIKTILKAELPSDHCKLDCSRREKGYVTVAERLACSLPTKAIRVQSPAASPGFSHVGIVPDDAAGRRGFLRDLPFPRLFSPALPLIGSKDLDIWADLNIEILRAYESEERCGAAPECRRGGNGRSPRKPTKLAASRGKAVHCWDTETGSAHLETSLYAIFTLRKEVQPLVNYVVQKKNPGAKIPSPITESNCSGRQPIKSRPFLSAVARALASHHGDPVSIPGGFTPGFSHVGIVLDGAACRWVFSGHSRFPRPCIPAPLHPRDGVMSCPGMTGIYGSQLESPSLGEYCLAQGQRNMGWRLLSSGHRKEKVTEIANSTLASHQGEPGSIPGRATGFSQVGIAPDDTAGRRVYSGIPRFPPPLHYGAAPYSLQSPSSALKTSLLRTAPISSLIHPNYTRKFRRMRARVNKRP
ncbi:hypothetical protein PR048_033612, partial [Dryococelus australis]